MKTSTKPKTNFDWYRLAKDISSINDVRHPFVVRVKDLNDFTETAIIDCLANMQHGWNLRTSGRYVDAYPNSSYTLSATFRFEDRDEALMFKLKYGV